LTTTPSHVTATREDRVLHLVLDRPAKKNALTRAMYMALADALTAAADDPAVAVVTLSGSGDAFTAGNDLADFASSGGDVSEVMRFLFALVDFPKPVLAAVHGAAVGIGTTLLLHCDLAWAAPSARFRTPFVELGLVPEAASSYLMPRQFGAARAARLLLLCETIDAVEAADWGLVAGVVAEDALHATVREKARALAAKAPEAVRASKALLRAPTREAVLAVMRREGDLFNARLTSPEAREAMMAFLQKRPPNFAPGA
jgi:enoyl-CoA hydratase/carnithine racemase